MIRCPALLALLLAAMVLPVARAKDTATLTTLLDFSGSNGELPLGSLVQGPNGNFYGTTSIGGGAGDGTVFEISSAGLLTTLHTFAGTDGSAPGAGLVLSTDGGFYGTTQSGGADNEGTVFKITAAGGFTTLVSFTGPNGEGPKCRLVQGSDGDFYGTTAMGGAGGYGTVFRMTPGGGLTTIHSFTSSDGSVPTAGLVQGGDGNFYGTTQGGGTLNEGTVFRVTPAGTLTTLHSFGDSDGELPLGGLLLGSDGNFYGTTSSGGDVGGGTVFQITPAGVLTTLHSFANSNGAAPEDTLVQGSDGNFYGTTSGLGANDDYGKIFVLTPAGDFTTLLSFDNTDGRSPDGGLVLGTDGKFYGTTQAGGTNNYGTVFQVAVATPLPAFFNDQVSLADGVYYLAFPKGNYFGYYSFLTDPSYLFHFDLGYEYVFDAADGNAGVYFYDFTSSDFFYTSPGFPFPYLYDFGLQSAVYYYPDPNNAGHYNTNGIRYFYVFSTGMIITR